MAWEHIHYYSQVFIMGMHLISQYFQVGSLLKICLTDLLQLEHWVYAKSVRAFMRLHMSIYHMQFPDSSREEICWMNECCLTLVRLG